MINYGDWRPEEALYEEVGVIYSWEYVEGFTAFNYTLIRGDLYIPRTVYIMGSGIDKLLLHWNSGDEWKVELVL